MARGIPAWLALILAGVLTGACDDSPAQDTGPKADLVKPSLAYDGGVLANVRGGERRGAGYIGNLHLRLHVNAPPGSSIQGSSAYVDVLSIHGGQPGDRVGDTQGTSSIEGARGTVIEELWVQQNSSTGALSVLAGIYDLNSEFYRLGSANLFLNSSFGIGPEFAQSGVAGPSIFPRTSAGVRLAWKPTAGIVVRGALLDGQPVVRPSGEHGLFRSGDGWLGVLEAAWLSRPGTADTAPSDPRHRLGRFSSLEPYQDKLAVGTWRYSTALPAVGGSSDSEPEHSQGKAGLYLVGERRFLGREPGATRTVSAFFHLGDADARTNRIARHIAVGAVGAGWMPGRSRDEFGLAVTSAINGSPYMRQQRASGARPHKAETTVELSYLTQITAWLTLQPDLQYVVHPNTERALANAWVVQWRFEVAF